MSKLPSSLRYLVVLDIYVHSVARRPLNEVPKVFILFILLL